MKIIFLIAPSEWKSIWWEFHREELTFTHEKPLNIAQYASEKDLKCIWERYKQWIDLNKTIDNWPFDIAINRYSWVVFNAISYSSMFDVWKKFFEENVFILSGMYWLLKPLDKIWNYKLPIEAKWLYKFWWDNIASSIATIEPDYIINLLPNSYAKLIWIWTCSKLKKIRNLYLWNWAKIINLNFYKDWKKLTHAVKKYRGEFLREICEKNLTDFKQFWWKVVDNWEFLEIDIVVK